ncbi:hypothetical protein [Rahnella victoriana]|uniref:hypothetical protein n=1 Tax=Rahnella victoriana TaxID=1510570 RepID=UPI0013FE011E|nr:hypothetical protein [Rahnella victoriana]
MVDNEDKKFQKKTIKIEYDFRTMKLIGESKGGEALESRKILRVVFLGLLKNR